MYTFNVANIHWPNHVLLYNFEWLAKYFQNFKGISSATHFAAANSRACVNVHIHTMLKVYFMYISNHRVGRTEAKHIPFVFLIKWTTSFPNWILTWKRHTLLDSIFNRQILISILCIVFSESLWLFMHRAHSQLFICLLFSNFVELFDFGSIGL